jgi:hypothetical protein
MMVYLGARCCAVQWYMVLYGSLRWCTVVRVRWCAAAAAAAAVSSDVGWCVVVYGGTTGGVWVVVALR